MNAIDQINGLDPDLKSELQKACDRLAQGIRNPDAARKSRERMARAREELRRRIGIQSIVVDLVRQSRESR